MELITQKIRQCIEKVKDMSQVEMCIRDSPVAAAMAKVSSDCSVAQPIIDMTGYWDAATPVSYTHLDVYKRQDTTSVSRH